MYTKSGLTKLNVNEIREVAKGLKIESYSTGTKTALIGLIIEAQSAQPTETTVSKNTLQAFLNGKLVQQFNVTGKDSTTISRFFNRFGGLVGSPKDQLIIKINGHEIDYGKVRSKINKIISANFLPFTAHAVYDPAKKKFVNENDEAVKAATKLIREGVAMTYETVNNFLKMDVSDFREALKKDEIFADYISDLDAESKKVLAWEA